MSPVSPGSPVNVIGHAGGASFEDFTGDGRLDIIASGRTLEDPLKFFVNTGEGFIDSTQQAGLNGFVGGLNLEHFDYNNDGDMDLLVLRGAWPQSRPGDLPNTLLRNNGDSTFTDVTRRTGLLTQQPTQTAAVADFNRDGWVDVFIGNEALSGRDQPSKLYLNQAGDSFVDVSERVGLTLNDWVKGASWGDVNGDGLPDLYVSIYRGNNKLYINEGGNSISDWSFRKAAGRAGVRGPKNSFATWFWDYNNDGNDDIFVANFNRVGNSPAVAAAQLQLGESSTRRNARPALYRNKGDGTFKEVSRRSNLTGIHHVMGSNYGDLTHDGFPGVYLGTGSPALSALVPNRFFGSGAGNSFVDRTTRYGLGHLGKGHAVAFGDFDDNGFSDLYQTRGGVLPVDASKNVLYRNRGNENNWIQLRLLGRDS
ncbi:MAG: FG-GAP repeat domain-containing protein, partial [bacterium]